MNELKYEILCATRGKVKYIAGGRLGFPAYTQKNVVSDPACGVEPYKFGGAQKAGQTPQSGQVICVYTAGAKGGV